MEEPARAVGAISERQGQRARTVQETRHPGDRLPEGFCVRTVAAAVFGETVTTRPRLGVVVLRAGNLDWLEAQCEAPAGRPVGGMPRRSAALSALGDKTAAVGLAIPATTGGLWRFPHGAFCLGTAPLAHVGHIDQAVSEENWLAVRCRHPASTARTRRRRFCG